MMPSWSDMVRRSIPIMLDGTGTPVAQTMSSPTARNRKMTASWKMTILIDFGW